MTSKALREEFTGGHEHRVETELEGFLDSFDGGIVSGWAWDRNHPERRLAVEIRTARGLVGSGVAEHFRDDLRKAGIGDGRHAYRIKITPLSPGQEVSLVLFDATSQKPIKASPLQVEVGPPAHIEFSGVGFGTLRGVIDGQDLSDESLALVLTGDNGEASCRGEAHRGSDGKYHFELPIPPELCDAMPHVLTVALADHPGQEASYADIMPSVLTPWEHIASSAKQLNYPGLARTAAYRYDSLRKQLEGLDSEADPKKLRHLMRAHQVVLEGWNGRSAFPKLSLPATTDPDVTIVIPVHDKLELTYHCLASLVLAWNRANYEVIVVDDASTDRTTELEDIVENVHLVVNEQNLGFLRSCNRAAKLARGRHLVLLNNDTEVTSGWLDELLDTFRRFEGVGLAGSKLLYPDGSLQEAGGIVWANGQPWNLGHGGNPQDPQWSYTRQVDYVSGAALMVDRSVWNEVGGFSEEFAPAYYEDTDLAFKVRAAGYKTVYAPYSVVVHFEGMSSGRDVAQGVKKHQAINAPKFRAKWVDSYINNGKASFDNVSLNKDRNIAYRVLMVDYTVPRPDHDAGSYAAVQEARMLQANGCKVGFVAENLAHMGKYTDALQRMGVECFYAPFYTSISQVLEKRGDEFDVVYITRYDVAERHLDQVREHTRAKVLFNNADLHFLRELRAALAAKHRDLSGPLATRDRELTLMRKVDGVLSYNPTEHAVILSHNLRGDNLHLCPWVVEARGHQAPWKDRSGVAFLGGYRHPPNTEAVQFFVEEVMPRLRQRLPGVAFHVYGSHMPESFSKYEAPDVVLEGFIESLDDVFETCRVFVAPMLSGAGIKGKVLEAMARGVPSVLTEVAAEATGLTHGVSAMIVETPEAWVDAIAELYEDQKLWESVSANALALARTKFSFESGVRGMAKALEGLGIYPPNSVKALTAK